MRSSRVRECAIARITINNLRLTTCAVAAALLLMPLLCRAELTIASLNPVVSDLAKQVGGERITVIELMKPGENPHVYQPTPEQLRKAHNAKVILAAGKGLETYLPDLRDSLGDEKLILEVGRKIPSLKLSKNDIFICCPNHASSAIDPHWWHSIKNLQRAARIISETLADLDPKSADYYKKRNRQYAKHLDKLNSWVKKEIYKIPRKERILTTAHTSFGYFCRDFGFKSVPVQGLSSEVNADPKHLSSVINTIRAKKIKAIFPEKNVNPELLETIIRETGVKKGGYLLAAGPEPDAPTNEAMIRHNVKAIIKALAPEQ